MPSNLLDWVALEAYRLETDEGASVISESLGSASVTYSKPRDDRVVTLQKWLIAPHLRPRPRVRTVEVERA